MDHHAGLGDLLESGLALEDDERAVALGGQPAAARATSAATCSTARDSAGESSQRERADPTDPLERPAQLRLEDDDQGEQADDRAGLEDPGQQDEVERDGQARRRRTGR